MVKLLLGWMLLADSHWHAVGQLRGFDQGCRLVVSGRGPVRWLELLLRLAVCCVAAAAAVLG